MSNNIDNNLNPIDDCLASSSMNKKSNPGAKLRMYWLSEIQKELEYYGKDLTEEELWTLNSGTFVASETKLNIKDIADLTLSFFNNNNTETYCKNFKPQSKPTSSKGHKNMDFEASNVVDEVLGLEDDNNQL
ncbi:17950_t:CDS:2 [Cetraspora pellucida]|uniref:17950_t:CDS:1 n=1 Tax=Cetraspora pellucida TaxID=1433469 RepID=A0A9N9NUT4_9GLOM|nr:17950_t:CDS:2 [Cetraspora pellucida]